MRRRNTEIFSLSFLDVICCGFGAVILLLVLTRIYEPAIIERGQQQLQGLLAALQAELFQIRGETVVLQRELEVTRPSVTEEQRQLAMLRKEIRRLQGQFVVTETESDTDQALRGELLAARQKLTDEMRSLLANSEPQDTSLVGGIPVDSEYIIFVIDTSGSMVNGAWSDVREKMQETLRLYPRIKGIQIMNDEGVYMFPSFAGRWMPDTSATRRSIISALNNWNPYSDSSPVEGIEAAIKAFYKPGRKISIYVFGDDFPRGSVEAVSRYVDGINKADRFGNRLVRIHGVGFPTQFAMGNTANIDRFSNLMRVLCERNGGTFVALTGLRQSLRIGMAHGTLTAGIPALESL